MPGVYGAGLDDAGNQPPRPRRVVGVLRELRLEVRLLEAHARELEGDAYEPRRRGGDGVAGSDDDAERGRQLAQVEGVADEPVGAAHHQAADVGQDPETAAEDG